MKGIPKLFLEILADEGQVAEGEVLADDDSDEEDDDEGVVRQRGPLGQTVGEINHAEPGEESKDHVESNALHGVADGVQMLAHEVGESHGHTVAREAGPGTGRVAVAGHEEHVDGDEHGTADA